MILNANVLKLAIETVVDYNWSKELEDYRTHESDGDVHIFQTLVALDNWINGTSYTPEEHMERDIP